MRRWICGLTAVGFFLAGNLCGLAEAVAGHCCKPMPKGMKTCCVTLPADRNTKEAVSGAPLRFEVSAAEPAGAPVLPERVFAGDVPSFHELHPGFLLPSAFSGRAPPATPLFKSPIF